MPVSYQNLLDGVIEFTVSDGHGGTQTLVPVAYSPNNDLYVSADQGGFEITNVHPGNNLYTELVLVGSWSGSGKSLISINVKPGPRVIGAPTVTYWPNVNTVSHQSPSGDVTIIFGNTDVNAKIESTDRFGNVSSYVSQNGEIVIPAEDVAEAVNRRMSLELSINDVVYSELFFLPEVESENFDLQGYIDENGQRVNYPGEVLTDFIDIYDVVELVYSGTVWGNGRAIAAYDENKDFVKILKSTGMFKNVHIPIDGTYRYVRACSIESTDHSLKLYFRTRG